MFWTIAMGDPGTHGVVTGVHGIGVSTPAAAVAAATAGFASDEHMPNGGMFVPGTQSWMFPAGVVATTGRTTENVDGAEPKLHFITAPVTT
jgi:hypothetical protein